MPRAQGGGWRGAGTDGGSFQRAEASVRAPVARAPVSVSMPVAPTGVGFGVPVSVLDVPVRGCMCWAYAQSVGTSAAADEPRRRRFYANPGLPSWNG
mmetsp:Transcript_1334/g.3622  ORF Transcript_1334/g.3622 Transcript_1334/m.3622 type:complete len:97 (+) Transcript_1334:59-349(+)|eukprot:363721-Chlamydomonas_euryale.AAC.1